MKNLFKKILFSSLFILLFVFCASIVKDDFSISFIPNACATDWGACNPDPAYQVCPSGIGAISDCVHSVNFDVTISSIGTAPIPAGTPFKIQIYPSDGSGSSCQYVTCLKRVSEYTTPGWGTAGNPYHVTLDQIGCDLTGHCTNNFTVQINFATSVTGISCPEYRQNFDVQNGGHIPVNYPVNCTSTQTFTCTTIIDQQQCQQNVPNSTNGCVTGWHPDPAAKTCDQTGGTNVCCIKDACTTPAVPANVRVTCSGCQ